MIGVVIPAHDEAGSIGRTLDDLVDDAGAGELDVVVVCNGCADDTAAIARAYGDRGIRVIETPVASKVHALNLGDDASTGFPRVYLDADVRLPTAAVRALAAALERPGVVAASTSLDVDDRSSSRAVRAYHRVWRGLPSIRDGLAGRGVYALTAEGRRRFGEFPDVIADDQFVNRLFRRDELVVIDHASVVRAPARLRPLVRRKVRSYLGNAELDALAPASRLGDAGTTTWLQVIRGDPRLLAAAPTYVAVNVVARLAARRRLRRGDKRWTRDETSRASKDLPT